MPHPDLDRLRELAAAAAERRQPSADDELPPGVRQRDVRARLRAAYGVPCDGCRQWHPGRIASILLPQQRCRVCGTIDQRPALTDKERRAAAGVT